MNQFSHELCSKIFTQILGHFVKLSQNKYSSKFIEICIDKAPLAVQTQILREFADSIYLHKVVESNFGNYVLQNSLGKYFKTDDLKI